MAYKSLSHINTDGTANESLPSNHLETYMQNLFPSTANNSDKWDVPYVAVFCSAASVQEPMGSSKSAIHAVPHSTQLFIVIHSSTAQRP